MFQITNFNIANLFYCKRFLKHNHAFEQPDKKYSSLLTKQSFASIVQASTPNAPIDTPVGVVTDVGDGYKAIKVPQKIYEERLLLVNFQLAESLLLKEDSHGDMPILRRN